MKKGKPSEDKKHHIPEENIIRGMTPPSSFIKKVLWRPNNYRRQILINKGAKIRAHSRVLKSNCKFVRYEPSNKQIYVKKGYLPPPYNNIGFQLSDNTLIATWSQSLIGGHKETFLTTLDGIEIKKKEIEGLLDGALRLFIKRFGIGKAYERIVWSRHEDWVKGESYIDSIPRETVVYDTVFKKVYEEGIEFIGGKGVEPVAKLKNFIKNRVEEDFIIKEIGDLKRVIGLRNIIPVWAKGDPLKYILDNDGLHDLWFSLSEKQKLEVIL